MAELLTPAYRYRAKLHRVIDGDTYELDVDLGFGVFSRVPIRLRGYNSAEMNTAAGKAAKLRAELLLTGAALLIETKKIGIRDAQSFARYVADVYIGGEHVGAQLARDGFAQVVEYS